MKLPTASSASASLSRSICVLRRPGFVEHRAIAIAPTGAHGKAALLSRQFVFMDGPST